MKSRIHKDRLHPDHIRSYRPGQCSICSAKVLSRGVMCTKYK